MNENVKILYDASLAWNIIPNTWFENIKRHTSWFLSEKEIERRKHEWKEAGRRKTDLLAINILSELLYRYRPKVSRDQDWKDVISKKFHGDMLQKSYQELADKFWVTKNQIKDSVTVLEKLWLISKEFRVISTKTGLTLSNVLFIDIDATKILNIGLGDSYLRKSAPLWKKSPIGIEEKEQTYTKTTTKISSQNSNIPKGIASSEAALEFQLTQSASQATSQQEDYAPPKTASPTSMPAEKSYWNNDINVFLSKIKEMYEQEWIEYFDPKERQSAWAYIKKWEVTSTKKKQMEKEWCADIYEWIKLIMQRAKSIKYGNYTSKITNLKGIRRNYAKINEAYKKENWKPQLSQQEFSSEFNAFRQQYPHANWWDKNLAYREFIELINNGITTEEIMHSVNLLRWKIFFDPQSHQYVQQAKNRLAWYTKPQPFVLENLYEQLSHRYVWWSKEFMDFVQDFTEEVVWGLRKKQRQKERERKINSFKSN